MLTIMRQADLCAELVKRAQSLTKSHLYFYLFLKLEEEKPGFDDDDDDLDDLLDDLDVNPVLFKKPEDPRLQEITDTKDEDTNDESMEGLMWTCVDCKMKLAGHKVTELLEKTSSSQPGVTCNEIAKHEAFLSATAPLLHPNNYQVSDNVILDHVIDNIVNTGHCDQEDSEPVVW